MKESTRRWVGRADVDLQMARLALGQDLYEPYFFHCQQAIEKVLKALLIERGTSGRVRRTHDLVSLAEQLELSLSDPELRLLRRLTEIYVPTRYGDEDVDLEELAPNDWLNQTEELFSWLRQKLT